MSRAVAVRLYCRKSPRGLDSAASVIAVDRVPERQRIGYAHLWDADGTVSRAPAPMSDRSDRLVFDPVTRTARTRKQLEAR